jgi:anaerobic selenocysteine-containing dehydrogenase
MPSIIEKIAESLGLIPNLHQPRTEPDLDRLEPGSVLTNYPPPEQWHNWTEYEAKSWPRRERKTYDIVPTTCFNCEAACGLLAYVDKENGKVRKFEGNPMHPASRGRNCAKGPATINQINDTDRILYPLKREGKRGDGQWKRVTWDEVLDDLAARIRKALLEERHNEIAYHVGRPGHEGFMDRILQSWGIDGHNSHTNICSSGARFGYAIWHGYDRPSPDHANARVILLISAHLESGHYFNPHAQRIIEAKMKGARLVVIDPRLSNTASLADNWLPSYPGSEAALLLAMAKVILDEGLFDRDYLENWVNWQQWLKADFPEEPMEFDTFIRKLKETYAEYTPEFAEKESGVKAAVTREVAIEIGKAGSRFASHNWRSASSGNLGGWAVARALHFLSVLTGSVGTEGGTSPNDWNKFKPKFFDQPGPQKHWNELHFPKEYPLAFFEMSFLLPHFLKEKRGRLDTYFTRVFNPVWTYPDGFVWIEALSDEEAIGCHVALTPTWSETAYFADYVLPMGHASERHDLNTYETHAGIWIAFRQPVLREVARRQGKDVKFTYEVNPGEVWEEDEFWTQLSWRIDPDGSLGIRKHFESPYRPGQCVTVDEYYQYIFENTKGLPETAAKEGLSPLEYMRKYGAFVTEKSVYKVNEYPVSAQDLEGSSTDPETGVISKNGKAVGVMVKGKPCTGFITPSRKQEFYSPTMVGWKWPEHRIPGYLKSHVDVSEIDYAKGEFPLIPTFRLPVLIHSRSGNAKWLYEIANRNPIWIHPTDALRIGVETGDLLRVNTETGYFVDKVWVTEGLKPGILACSHHLGRWRRPQDALGNRWATATVNIENDGKGGWKMKTLKGITPFKSADKDSSRIFWSDGGVHQNITFPVHPDPISGMHCWHQKVRVEKALEGDHYGDIFVDTNKSMEIYRKWLALARPAPGPGNLRRPLWMKRALRPTDEAYKM